jgi:hypothetical protein
MSIGITAFTAIYATMPDAHCTVQLADKTAVAVALSAGLQLARDYDDRGIAGTISGNVRYLSSSETGRKAQIGDVIKVTLAGQSTEISVRVAARLETAGAVRLDVEGLAER